jgi:ABC-2 type transport system ATP-binding protein
MMPESPTSVAVQADRLTKQYDDRPALAPLDLTIVSGSSIALMGHNGSGKTTLLKMAAGLLEPTAGSIAISGFEAGSIGARAALSFLADSPTFYDDLSVWEHLEYVARLHGNESWEQHAADLLGHLGLTERADHLPVTFSRGLRQKAAIALAFVRPFDVLMVDEPFVGLDVSGRDALIDLLDEAHRGGATIVVATHELSFVEHVQRLVMLADGDVVYDGSSDIDQARRWIVSG